MEAPFRVLLVEDDPAQAKIIAKHVVRANGDAHIHHVDRMAAALENLESAAYDVILLDLGLPDNTGLDGLRLLRHRYPEIPIVVLTALEDDSLALEALHHGAQDYTIKQAINAKALQRIIQYSIKRQKNLSETRNLLVKAAHNDQTRHVQVRPVDGAADSNLTAYNSAAIDVFTTRIELHNAVTSDYLKLEVLRWLTQATDGQIRPTPCLTSPDGFAYPDLERALEFAPGQSAAVLAELAGHGLLSQRVVNRVHVCRRCECWTLLFREICPQCGSVEVELEEMIHHFACAGIDLASKYEQGATLQCPKCQQVLRHIGVDYERPTKTYSCQTCQSICSQPDINAECVNCQWSGNGADVGTRSVYAYEINERTQEALERGEIAPLRLRDAIQMSKLDLHSREYFEHLVARELIRVERYERPISIVIAKFSVADKPYKMFTPEVPSAVADYTQQLAAALRPLDIAAMMTPTTLGVLLPETDEAGRDGLTTRLEELTSEFDFCDSDGRSVTNVWVGRTWTQVDPAKEEPLRWCCEQVQPPATA